MSARATDSRVYHHVPSTLAFKSNPLASDNSVAARPARCGVSPTRSEVPIPPKDGYRHLLREDEALMTALRGCARQRDRRHVPLGVPLGGITLVMVMSLCASCGLVKPRASNRASGATAAAASAAAAPQIDPRSGTTLRAAEAAPTEAPVFRDPPASVHARQPAPVVNVFGELDDEPAFAPEPSGEAGFQQHTYLEEGYDADVAVSPDGTWIAFSSTRHTERGDIYLQRVDGLSVTQLTSDPDDDANPAFSPDGTRIAFASARAGTWDIYLMNVDGSNVTQVTSGPMQDLHPSFAPDGRRLVYCSAGSRSGQWELWTVDLGTLQKRMIGFGLFPSWCPDPARDRIAFQRARARGSRWFSLWTLELVDGEARNVSEIAVSTNSAVVSPVWSPDGRRIAFSTIVEPAKSSNGRPRGQQDVWVINADGTGRSRLTDGKGVNAAPYWGAGDRVYFVSDRGGSECIWSASARSGRAAPPSVNVQKPPDAPAALGSAE
jgi:TolB protein